MLTDKQIRDAKPRTTVYRLRDTQSVCRGFGVGLGFKPPKFLKAGDTVSVAVDSIGTLTNPVQ